MNWSRLTGINYVLKRCAIRPVAALDTGGSSEAADVERIIDEETHARQVPGVAENRANSIKHIADVTTGFVQLGAAIIAVKSAGPSQHRNLSMRLNGAAMYAYDLNRNTFAFTPQEEIFLDLTFEIPFEACSPGLQQIILDAAAQVYQRMNSNNPFRDQQLGNDRARSEAMLDRTGGRSESPHDNPPAMQPQRGQGGQG